MIYPKFPTQFHFHSPVILNFWFTDVIFYTDALNALKFLSVHIFCARCKINVYKFSSDLLSLRVYKCSFMCYMLNDDPMLSSSIFRRRALKSNPYSYRGKKLFIPPSTMQHNSISSIIYLQLGD